MTYEAAGRMLTLVEPRGNASGANPADYTTTFTYDEAGNLLSTTDALGHATTQDLAISTVGGGVTGGLLSNLVGLTTLGKALSGSIAGAGTSVASQVANGRDLDWFETAIGGLFGGGGAVIDFGSGAIGTFRGLVGGGAISALQSFILEWLQANAGQGSSSQAGK